MATTGLAVRHTAASFLQFENQVTQEAASFASNLPASPRNAQKRKQNTTRARQAKPITMAHQWLCSLEKHNHSGKTAPSQERSTTHKKKHTAGGHKHII